MADGIKRRAALALMLTACVDLGGTSDTAVPNLANLVVSGFWYENMGTEYVFTALVENQGYAPADTFSVDLYLDRSTEPREIDQGDASEIVLSGVAVDGVVEVSITVPADQVCSGCLTWVYVDSSDQVAEVSEDDNSAGPTEILSR